MGAVVNKKILAHVVAVPFPSQGHVKPLLKLSRQIANQGIKVTFVNIQSVHHKILTSHHHLSSAAAAGDQDDEDADDNLVLTSIPDGRGPDDDPNDTLGLLMSLRTTMPGFLADLIRRINGSDCDHKVTCVIGDIAIGWILDTARDLGAEPVVFSPPSAASLAVMIHLPNLLEEGKVDSDGNLKTGEVVRLSSDIPAWKQNELPWSVPIDLKTQRMFFDCSLRINKVSQEATWLLCNTCSELEPSACDLIPNLLPIGPLLERNGLKSSGNFLVEDETCLDWLDGKPPGSVVYVSFGSLAVFSQQQLDELALGLELSNRAFLWVARPDLANGSPVVYPSGFLERTEGIGKIVEWAPQERVLAHRSTACFLSHCGWNSTLEGLSNGVPFLCWPYFSDQMHDQSYLCDEWGMGLRIDAGEDGIRTRHEIRTKIDMVFDSECKKLKENAMKMKELCSKSVGEGGSSCNNFARFIASLKN